MFYRKFKRTDSLYVISDPHLYHKNLTRGESSWENLGATRDFKTVQEMSQSVIDSIWSVPEGSTIFVLGDMFFGEKKYVEDLLLKLSVKYRLVYIMGNHCTWFRKQTHLHSYFEFVGDYLEIFWAGKLVCMFHYPISVWNEGHKNSWLLCGHSHGTHIPSLPETKDTGKILDCGWDLHKRPLSFLEVEAIMQTKKYIPKDHHNKETT